MAPIDDARSEAAKAEQQIVEFFDAVNDLLSRAAPGAPATGPAVIPAEIVEEVRRGAEQIGREFRGTFDRLQQDLSEGGDSERLRLVAAGWTRLGNDVGTTAAAVGLDRMRANVEWEGTAARSYVAMVPAQADRGGR